MNLPENFNSVMRFLRTLGRFDISYIILHFFSFIVCVRSMKVLDVYRGIFLHVFVI